MNSALNKYTRLLKIITVWVMVVFLFAPITTIITPKTNTQNTGIEVIPTVAQAAECKVENAIFEPSSTGWKGSSFSDSFYKGRSLADYPKTWSQEQEKVVVKISTTGCVGKELSFSIINVTETPDTKLTIVNNKNFVDTEKGKEVKFTPTTNISTMTASFLPGEEGCSILEALGNNHCQLYLEINGDKTQSSINNTIDRDNQRGQLAYNCFTGSFVENLSNVFTTNKNAGCDDSEEWKLKSLTETSELVPILWYYKKTDAKTYYIVKESLTQSPFGQTECEAVVKKLAEADKTVDTVIGKDHSCIYDPPATDISDKDSVIDKGTGIGAQELKPCFSLTLTSSFLNIPACVAIFLKEVVWKIVAFAVGLIGNMFDFVFSYTISAEPYKNNFITVAWTFVRDICNASFIFILLYIAIMTVLNQTNKASYKTILPKVILVALVINFSLFFGRAIIDIGNVSARVLYNSNLVSLKNSDGTPGSISGALIDSFDPQKLIQQGSDNYNKVSGVENSGVDTTGFIVITLMSIVMLFLFAKILLELTFVFIGRIVGLWMQLILAPIAFIASAVPFLKIPAIAGGGGAWSWFETTFKQSIQAAVFAFFLYLTLIFAKIGIVAVKMNDVSSGIAFFLSIIIPFLIIYTLLETAKKQSISMATAIANTATEAVKGVVGTVAKVGLLAGSAAVAPMAARTLGGLASKVSNSGMLKSLSGRAGMGGNFISKGFNNFIADTASKTSGGLAKISKNNFDFRESGLAKGAFKMAGFGDTKSIDFNIPGVPKNIISEKLNNVAKSAGETSRLKGLDAMAEEKKKQMEQRLANMKLTEDNIDKNKVKDDRHEMAVWLKKQREELNTQREAAKTAGTTFDEKTFKASYEATNAKPKLNYKASASTKDAKVIAGTLNKKIENRFARRMEREANTPSLTQKTVGLFGKDAESKIKKAFNISEDPNRKAQKKFAKDSKKANAKIVRKRSILAEELEKIQKQEIGSQKNLDKLTKNVDSLVTALSANTMKAKGIPGVESYKEILEKKMREPSFVAKMAELSDRSKYPADHPAIKELERKVHKSTEEKFNEQYEKPLDDLRTKRDLAKIEYDAVKDTANKKDPDYLKYKKGYEDSQKKFATAEAEINSVNKVIKKVSEKQAVMEKEMEKRNGLQSQRRKTTKTLGTI